MKINRDELYKRIRQNLPSFGLAFRYPITRGDEGSIVGRVVDSVTDVVCEILNQEGEKVKDSSEGGSYDTIDVQIAYDTNSERKQFGHLMLPDSSFGDLANLLKVQVQQVTLINPDDKEHPIVLGIKNKLANGETYLVTGVTEEYMRKKQKSL